MRTESAPVRVLGKWAVDWAVDLGGWQIVAAVGHAAPHSSSRIDVKCNYRCFLNHALAVNEIMSKPTVKRVNLTKSHVPRVDLVPRLRAFQKLFLEQATRPDIDTAALSPAPR